MEPGTIFCLILIGAPLLCALWVLNIWIIVKFVTKFVFEELRNEEPLKYIKSCARMIKDTLEKDEQVTKEEGILTETKEEPS